MLLKLNVTSGGRLNLAYPATPLVAQLRQPVDLVDQLAGDLSITLGSSRVTA
jgi:hypothetical protein